MAEDNLNRARNAGNGSKSGAGSNGGSSDDGVNPKIIDAVEKSTEFVFGIPSKMDMNTGGTPTQAYNAGTAISYEKVAQAAAYQIQDGTDYQRNMLSINGAAQGKALALMFEDIAKGPAGKTDLIGHALIYILATAGNFAAAATNEYIGKSASTTLENYGEATNQTTAT